MKYFSAVSNYKYINKKKDFESYFLTFKEGCRLEIMTDINGLEDNINPKTVGLTHFAISTGSKEKVVELTEQIRDDGHEIAGEPRITGDGYFESIVEDPDGNLIEITI